jgi:electron transport complex protein RnfG
MSAKKNSKKKRANQGKPVQRTNVPAQNAPKKAEAPNPVSANHEQIKAASSPTPANREQAKAASNHTPVKTVQPKATPKPVQNKDKKEPRSVKSKTKGWAAIEAFFTSHELLRVTLTLFVITAVTALLLGVVNLVTKDRIADLAANAHKEAMQTVLKADEYRTTNQSGGLVTALTEAYNGDTLAGYCVDVTTSGFGGDIDLMVGVDTSDAVLGVKILNQSETPGVGTKAEESTFLNQYTGETGTINVTNGENAIDAITGATITSKAVTKGVNAAIAAVQTIMEGGTLNAG